MDSLRVAVVGAGSSGIVALKTLRERGIDAVAFELGSGVGGNWRFGNDNGMSSAYRSLHINTSRTQMAYSDFPMPDDYPDFPHHSQILAYFEDYVAHFGLREHIRFGTRVVAVAPDERAAGRWTVTTAPRDAGEQPPEAACTQAGFDAVLVANGHHWAPRLPSFDGEFAGTLLHSHDYKTHHPFEGKRVLVIGAGNSAVDIACELGRIHGVVHLSTRRGAHVVPKYVLGRPVDAVIPAWLQTRTPLSWQRAALRLLLWLARGAQQRYGFPTPQTPLLAEHPTVSSELLPMVGHGRVRVLPDVERFDGGEVCFVDGQRLPFDVVIAATGYRVVVPFLDASIFDPQGNEAPLYLRVVPPAHPGLFFVGLLQPLGAIMPLAEAQSRWIADVLLGNVALPSRAEMARAIDRERAAMRARYVRSERHTMQVDFHAYRERIERERRVRARAAAGARGAAP